MKFDGEIEFSHTIERIPAVLRLRRGRWRCGTHIFPLSFSRRAGTGSRCVPVDDLGAAVARTVALGRERGVVDVLFAWLLAETKRPRDDTGAADTNPGSIGKTYVDGNGSDVFRFTNAVR